MTSLVPRASRTPDRPSILAWLRPWQGSRKHKMSDTDEYILNAIKTWVWSGFYSPADVNEMIEDILEDDEADEALLRAAVLPEFARKAAQEVQWPQETDCDRLDAAFAALEKQGVLALQNAGATLSEGHQNAFESLEERGREQFMGYCFYHGRDMERAL